MTENSGFLTFYCPKHFNIAYGLWERLPVHLRELLFLRVTPEIVNYMVNGSQIPHIVYQLTGISDTDYCTILNWVDQVADAATRSKSTSSVGMVGVVYTGVSMEDCVQLLDSRSFHQRSLSRYTPTGNEQRAFLRQIHDLEFVWRREGGQFVLGDWVRFTAHTLFLTKQAYLTVLLAEPTVAEKRITPVFVPNTDLGIIASPKTVFSNHNLWEYLQLLDKHCPDQYCLVFKEDANTPACYYGEPSLIAAELTACITTSKHNMRVNVPIIEVMNWDTVEASLTFMYF